MLRQVALIAGVCTLLLIMLAGLVGDPGAPVAPSAAAGTPSPAPLATTSPVPMAPEVTPTATPRAAPTPMAVSAAVGQRIVTGYRGVRPPASVLRAVRAGRLGGVILFRDNVPTPAAARRAIRSLQAAARAGGRPPLLIMVDQEGGEVRRLPTLPPHVSPARMGASSGPAATAEAHGRRTGAALRRLGVNVNLAPVADVPDGPANFLGERAFSRSRDVVARAACGFAAGLSATGVAPTLKHFPGLGRAGGNTDLQAVSVPAGRGALAADLAAYKRCAPTVPLVMLSSAAYPALGIGGPAVLDRRAYRLLATTGFKGLTITDAFDTPSIAGHFRPARRALSAGVDLLLYGQNEAGARQAYARLLEDARAGRLSNRTLRAKAERVVAFKQSLAAVAGE